MTYTLEDYETALAKVIEIGDRISDYMGNNPNKYEAESKAAHRKLRRIRRSLQAEGILPMTEQEALEAELNKAFPNPSHKQVVVLNGLRYQCRYYPVEKSRSRKTVTEWGKEWEEIK
jgi:hypothetical protein